MKIFKIPHPQVGDVLVRECQDGTYQECTKRGTLVLSVASLYQGLSEAQVKDLGGVPAEGGA